MSQGGRGWATMPSQAGRPRMFRIVVPEESRHSNQPQVIRIGPGGAYSMSPQQQPQPMRVTQGIPDGFRITRSPTIQENYTQPPQRQIQMVQPSGSGTWSSGPSRQGFQIVSRGEDVAASPQVFRVGPQRYVVSTGVQDDSAVPSSTMQYQSRNVPVQFISRQQQPQNQRYNVQPSQQQYQQQQPQQYQQQGLDDTPASFNYAQHLLNRGPQGRQRSCSVDMSAGAYPPGQRYVIRSGGSGEAGSDGVRFSFASASGSQSPQVVVGSMPGSHDKQTDRNVFLMQSPSQREPAYVPTNPRSQANKIQEALNSRRMRRQQSHDFDDLINNRMQDFVDRRREYVVTSPDHGRADSPGSPRDGGSPQHRGGSPQAGGDRRGSGPRVFITRQQTRDLGDGRKQTITETRQLGDSSPQPQSPGGNVSYTITSPGSSPNNTIKPETPQTPSGKNLFKKYGFQFDSIGNFGRSNSQAGSEKGETFHFQDFDDMIGKIRELRVNPPPATVIPPAPCGHPDCQYTCHHKCRQHVTLDCASEGKIPDKTPAKNETSMSAGRPQADDADSGYHTGNSTLQAAPRPPGDWTLTREDLRRNIETFNNNNHGLIMSLQQDSNTFQGFIRVHMNLIRPINMSLSARPPSIYDVMGNPQEPESPTDTDHITSFYLPKDTTKVIHIDCDTTAQEVIKVLLAKFKITDNPRKFALYERIVTANNKATMHRLEDDERPLPLCLDWTKEGIDGLDIHKYILQENDTGEIMWEAFSLPELENFLRILDKEEEEYVDQVNAKYRLLRSQMHHRLKELRPDAHANESDDSSHDKPRQPVFV